ncbi:hypothetical protein Hamer_G008131, partial [Homarus americanus]
GSEEAGGGGGVWQPCAAHHNTAPPSPLTGPTWRLTIIYTCILDSKNIPRWEMECYHYRGTITEPRFVTSSQHSGKRS